jgi:hypothetical protein
MAGATSTNLKKGNSKIYNERMLSRAGSVNSNSSLGPGARVGAARNYTGL